MLNYEVVVYGILIKAVSIYAEISLSYSDVITKKPFGKAMEVLDGRISGVTLV